MQTRTRLRRQGLATRIIGYILIGESIALPAWMLVKGGHKTDPPATVTQISCDGASHMDIIPVTIYDGPPPATHATYLRSDSRAENAQQR